MWSGVRHRRSDLALAAGVGAVALAVGIAGCGGSNAGGSNSPKARPSVVSSPTPNVAKISNELLTAGNQMISADNTNLANFNALTTAGGSPATATAGINATIQDHQTFDAAINGISFPAADSADGNSVLNADSAYENDLATLAVNTNDVGNYNSVFDTVLPLQSAFQAALTTLDSDFGITSSATPTPSP